ncbi:MAG: hypothetical protein WBH47_21120 [Streptosporangiaceae bacterium]
MTTGRIHRDPGPAGTEPATDRFGVVLAEPPGRAVPARAGPGPAGSGDWNRAAGWRARWPLLVVIAWVALAVADVGLFGLATSSPQAASVRGAPTLHAGGPAGASQRASPRPTAVPRASRPTPVPLVLSPVSATAVGSAGPQSGDNPASASLAIDASAATAWHTDWYASAALGNLQAGTGLLIDMGRPVTISTVRLVLGSAPGADLQLLTGDTPDRSAMQVQASASAAGGTLVLRAAAPERARYLIIWFTLLPPDSAGTFQASVYDVRIEGAP